MWADVSMKLYPTLPGQRGFSFPLCAERQPRPRVRPRRAWNDRRPSRLATGLFWRELIADRRGGHYRSSCTERILIRFIGDRLRDRPPVKFRCPRTRSRRDCVARAPRAPRDRASKLISRCRPGPPRPSSTAKRTLVLLCTWKIIDTPPRLERARLSSRCSSRRWWTSVIFYPRGTKVVCNAVSRLLTQTIRLVSSTDNVAHRPFHWLRPLRCTFQTTYILPESYAN